jgi:hypothetical protein
LKGRWGHDQQPRFLALKGVCFIFELLFSCSITAWGLFGVRWEVTRVSLSSLGRNTEKQGFAKQSFSSTFFSRLGPVTRNTSAAAAAAAFLLPPQRIIPTARLVAKRGDSPFTFDQYLVPRIFPCPNQEVQS